MEAVTQACVRLPSVIHRDNVKTERFYIDDHRDDELTLWRVLLRASDFPNCVFLAAAFPAAPLDIRSYRQEQRKREREQPFN